jgi:hypothetical protein
VSTYYWEKVFDSTLSSASTSITISGLDGDQDLEYKLSARIVNGYNGQALYYARPNNDSGGANYGYQGIYGINTDATASRSTTSAFRLGDCSAINYINQSETTIHAKSGYVRTAIIKQCSSITGTTVNDIDLMGMSWNNTADNITSLVVLADQNLGIGIGSQITLYKKSIVPSVTTDSGTKRLGLASGYFNGTTHLTITDSANWSFGTGNFSLQLWFNFSDITGKQTFLSQYKDASNYWEVFKDSNHKLGLTFATSGVVVADYLMTSAWTPLTNQWYNLEFTRNANNILIFINGISQTLTASTQISTNDVGNVAAALGVGGRTDGCNFCIGRMDELRISKGIARHTVDFTPPSAPFTQFGGLFTTVTGLSHLEDRVVSILADGNVLAQQTVTGSSVTLVNLTSIAHVGLPYNSDLETLNVELNMPDGTLQGRKVQISRVVIRMNNSRGGYVGPDFDHLYEILGDYNTSVSTSLFTGDVKIPLGGGYSDGGRFCFRQSEPLPITILGCVPVLTVGGTTGLD